jgi:isopenicillin-N epimerase
MLTERVAEFPISPELVMLNHASFGLMTTQVMELAQRTRAELEADSLALIDPDAIVPRLRAVVSLVEDHLGVESGSVALTQNATSGAAALMRSIPLREGGQVVVLATEYDSIVRGWRARCEEIGARFVLLRVPLPVHGSEQLVDALEREVHGDVAIAQLSLVTSSTAITLPVAELTSWFKSRGALVLADIAHGPGHVAVAPAAWGLSAMFGTLHKWYPTPRPVGLLWLDGPLRDSIRPAEVSLTWDSTDLVERFAWPGTFDPTPRFCVPAAIAQWREWESAGDLERCEKLADYASDRLAGLGTPTCDPALRPPRLRAVVLPGRSRAAVRAALDRAKVRGWTGTGPNGETVVRIATHVFNEESDVDRLCDAIDAGGSE